MNYVHSDLRREAAPDPAPEHETPPAHAPEKRGGWRGWLLGLGVLFGWAIVRSIADDGVSELAIPGPQLMVIAALGAATGIPASVLPARRAARLSIPQAVTS